MDNANKYDTPAISVLGSVEDLTLDPGNANGNANGKSTGGMDGASGLVGKGGKSLTP
jgi:hypothetical protein